MKTICFCLALMMNTALLYAGNGDLIVNGNLGVGINPPANKLDVAGNLKLSGPLSTIFTTGFNNTTHVGGVQFVTPNNGATTILTPTNQTGASIDSTLTLGGFGYFNSNHVNLRVSGNLGLSSWVRPDSVTNLAGIYGRDEGIYTCLYQEFRSTIR